MPNPDIGDSASTGAVTTAPATGSSPRFSSHPNAAVDLAGVLREVTDDGLIEAEARGYRVEVQVGAEPRVAGRGGLLHRAIENVTRNAIRYAPPSTAVTGDLTVDGGRAVLTVCDRGPGVPKHALESIFEPFFRVEEHRGHPTGDGGVGLGLAIARRAVTVHGGRITARNAGPGLEVRIELPAHALDALGPPASPPPDAPPARPA